MNNPNYTDDFGNIALGLYDIPYSPEATVLYLNLLKSNAVIFGTSMTGKTTMVKNILARMHELEPYKSWENIYILDFGGNIGKYAELGRVCACFDNSNEENIKRIFKIVEQKFIDNTRVLNGENFLTYQQSHLDSPLPHITLIIENVTAFLAEERYSSYRDTLVKLSRDGISKGVSVLLTSSDYNASLSRMMVNFSRKFALEMQENKYADIFMTRVDDPIRLPGRGVTFINNKPCEFQAYLPFAEDSKKNDKEDADEQTEKKPGIDELIEASADGTIEKLKSFPAELRLEDVPHFNSDIDLLPYEVLTGLDYYDHTPIAVDLDEMHIVAIYGKKQFGKTNLLKLILRGAYNKYPGAEFILFDDAREQLKWVNDELTERGFRVKYVSDFKEFKDIMKNPEESSSTTVSEFPTFVIIQNKLIYSKRKANKADGFYMSSSMAVAEERNQYFIFTDVPKIVQKDIYDDFNLSVKVAFLLDNIGEFLSEKGSSSVFNVLDSAEMKREYARCDIGDGYYYDVERDDLRKFKILKAD